jgi:hypothetical protein
MNARNSVGSSTGQGQVNKMPQPQITHVNHYVPQAVLKRWSIDGTQLFTYRILVPDANFPVWKLRAVSGVAFHRDLYTVCAGGKELDDFEKWVNVEYEQPGLEAIDKLLSGSQLTSADWHRMILFVAAQDVRTPLSYIESMSWFAEHIPKMLVRIMRDSIKQVEEATEQGIELSPKLVRNEFNDLLKVTKEPSADPVSDHGMLRAEVVAGRQLWIAKMRHLLTGVAKTLCLHRWSVAEPAGDAEWPLTDHPVIRLNYHKSDQYDFGGGWGHPGSEIMMPVSPRHLLYVQVGKKADNRFTFSPEHTQLVQRLLVERAHRWVFATRPEEWVTKVRQRTEDPEIFEEEEKAWEDYPLEQSQSEASSRRSEDPGED